MDKNALTEKRRETVIGLLKGMNIKKSENEGFDKEDVYECMQQLCDLYEKNINELENAYGEEISSLKERYQKYDDNNELYVSLIMEAKKSSNDIINQAKSEVENILTEGREQVAKQEAELEQMRVGIDAEKQAINEELNAAREAVEAEKAAMRAELEAEKEKVSALRSKYTRQLNSMEEEFEEIKTNILRTAGKIDSLKSKLPEEEDISWDILEDTESVKLPESEIEVDAVIDDVEIDLGTIDEVAVEEPVDEVTDEPIEEATSEPVDEEPSEAVEEIEADATEEVEAVEESETPEEAEEAPTTTFTLDDLMSDPIEELDSIEIDLPELDEEPAEEASEGAAEEVAEEEEVEEISFEGLEELFKED